MPFTLTHTPGSHPASHLPWRYKTLLNTILVVDGLFHKCENELKTETNMAWCYLVKWQNCYLYYVILRIWSRLILQKFLTPSDVVGSPFHSLQRESPKIIKLVSTTPGILRTQNLVNSSTIGLVCVRERGYKGRKRIKKSVIYF